MDSRRNTQWCRFRTQRDWIYAGAASRATKSNPNRYSCRARAALKLSYPPRRGNYPGSLRVDDNEGSPQEDVISVNRTHGGRILADKEERGANRKPRGSRPFFVYARSRRCTKANLSLSPFFYFTFGHPFNERAAVNLVYLDRCSSGGHIQVLVAMIAA